MEDAAEKKSKKGGERRQMIVLVDRAGNYYELTRDMLEESRVPKSRLSGVKKALEQAIAESSYINAPNIPGSVVAGFFVPDALSYAGAYVKRTK